MPVITPEIKLFNDIDPSKQLGWFDEVSQGGIGNCYVIATLNAVSKYPELIKDLFITKEINNAGIYQIQMFVRGKPWTVTVDDVILYNHEK